MLYQQTMTNNKVIILTDDSLRALGLKNILEQSFSITAIAVDNNFFAAFNATREPDLFFVDTNALLSNLTFFLPRKAKTIVLTSGMQQVEDFEVVNITATEQEITAQLNALLKQEEKQKGRIITTTLSQREIEVLKLVASGLINKEIAQELNISINTVLTHRKNLTAKLGIKSVSGLTFYAMMNGIV